MIRAFFTFIFMFSPLALFADIPSFTTSTSLLVPTTTILIAAPAASKTPGPTLSPTHPPAKDSLGRVSQGAPPSIPTPGSQGSVGVNNNDEGKTK
jgi:hypothetical protein